MLKPLSNRIHDYLNCKPTRVKEILIELAQTKNNFAPNLSLNQIWDQEKDYYKQYNCSSLKHLPS